MKLRIFAGLAIVFLVVSACTLPAKLLGSATSGNNSQEAAYVFATNADPVNVSVTLDESQSAEALIPIEGGTLSAQAGDGTIFTLEIPGDALLTETIVRMTPVSSLTGLPFGSDPLAVQLEPEGLFFNNFVTLSITPAQEIPIDQQILFGYLGAGQDVILAPPVVDSREIKIKLLHFSGYGVTKGLLSDIERVRQRIGGDAERRLQSQAAEALGRARQRQLLGIESSGSEIDWGSLFAQFYEQVVKPRMAAAGESCAAGRLALETALGYERQLQLVGAGDETGIATYGDLMRIVGTVCLKEEYQLCQEQHIIHRMIPVWLGIARQEQLLGVNSEGGDSVLVNLAKDLTKKCLTFELQFESTGVFNAPTGNGGWESKVKSKVKLNFFPEELKIRGQAPLVNEAFEFKVSGCSVTSNRGGGTFEAVSLVPVTDTHSPKDELGYVRDLRFSYIPGKTSESISVKCSKDKPSISFGPGGYWFSAFVVLHMDEISQEAGSSESSTNPAGEGGAGILEGSGLPSVDIPDATGFLMEDWEIFGNEYYAKKEWTKEEGSLGIIEVGTFKLYHRPGQ